MVNGLSPLGGASPSKGRWRPRRAMARVIVGKEASMDPGPIEGSKGEGEGEHAAPDDNPLCTSWVLCLVAY